MFFKKSRYRKLPDEVTVDRQGRRLLSKTLRSQPEVTGIFWHTIEDGDRLDHLAYKYYNQSRKWWRICDANPEFMSPQALLGKTSLITQRFPISFNRQIPWTTLRSELVSLLDLLVWLTDGERFLIITLHPIDSNLIEIIEKAGFSVNQPQTIGGIGEELIILRIFLRQKTSSVTLMRKIARLVKVPVWLTDDESYLIVTLNPINNNLTQIIELIEKEGFSVEEPQIIGGTGEQLAILPLFFKEQPPWSTLMRTITNQVGVQDIWLTDDESYLIITFNQVNIQSGNLTDMLGEAGFNVGQAQTIERTGKQIVIPPNIVG